MIYKQNNNSKQLLHLILPKINEEKVLTNYIKLECKNVLVGLLSNKKKKLYCSTITKMSCTR